MNSLFKYLMSLLMLAAGTLHFVKTDFFLKIVPPYLPWPVGIVYASGVFELAFGLMLLIPVYSRLAAWGIVALLIAVFPANIYVYQHQELVPASPIVHFLRLPLQGVLIVWAYCLTRPSRHDTGTSHAKSIELNH